MTSKALSYAQHKVSHSAAFLLNFGAHADMKSNAVVDGAKDWDTASAKSPSAKEHIPVPCAPNH